MRYIQGIEDFRDFEDFSQDSNCIWVVYPAGGAGDLIASLINFHYIRTGARCFGITNTGQVIFRDSGKKTFNKTNAFNKELVYSINERLGDEHLNMSLLDQVIFSNHGYRKETVNNILDFFPNAKIVRILPRNNIEYSVIQWLMKYKNQNQLTSFKVEETFKPIDSISHPRVLELFFGDLLSKDSFDACYDKIVTHLNLEYKLIRFDFINFWISNQHPLIQPSLRTLSS